MSTLFDRYRRELDDLQFSDEAMSRMTARLKEAAANSGSGPTSTVSTAPSGAVADAPNAAAKVLELPHAGHPMQTGTRRAARHPKRHALRYAAVVAIAAGLTLGGTSAYAAATQRSLPAVFSDVFGGAPAQTKIIDKIGYPIGASATSNGITMTADAVIGDASSLTVVFSIEREDGRPLTDLTALAADGGDAETAAGRANPKDKLLLGWGGAADMDIDGMSGGGGGYYFYDADPSDPSVQFVWTWSNVGTFDGKTLVGRTVRMHLSDLVSYADGMEHSSPIAKGQWDLKFELGYEDASISVKAGQHVDVNGTAITVNKIFVSPVGASITYTVDAVNTEPIPESGYADTLPTDKFLSLPFVVTFKDGHTEEATAGTSDYQEKGGNTMVTKGMSFGAVTNVDDIASITVGDQVIPVG